MIPCPIHETADSFLRLLEFGDTTPEARENQLRTLLDKLAYEIHLIQFEFDTKEYPSPKLPQEFSSLDRAMKIFPNLRPYRYVEKITDLSDQAAANYRDPFDDITDIAGDLHEFTSRWQRSPQDALWHLEFTFKVHWGEHLRHLQLYLHSRLNPE